MTFVISVLAGGTLLALSAIFEKNEPPFPTGNPWFTLRTMVVPALTTAFIAPLLFMVVRRIEGISTASRREERAVA
jgi:hypothetical protein